MVEIREAVPNDAEAISELNDYRHCGFGGDKEQINFKKMLD